jgi:hypothetical protein
MTRHDEGRGHRACLRHINNAATVALEALAAALDRR